MRNTLIDIVRSYVNDSQIQPNSTFIYLSTCQFNFHNQSVNIYLSIICLSSILPVCLSATVCLSICVSILPLDLRGRRTQKWRTNRVTSHVWGQWEQWSLWWWCIEGESKKKAWLRTINSGTCLAGTLALLLCLNSKNQNRVASIVCQPDMRKFKLNMRTLLFQSSYTSIF